LLNIWVELSAMSLELDIIELYNPLYLLPIVGVVFCALLVYAFGFKSVSNPPNFQLFIDKKKEIVNNTKKKKVIKREEKRDELIKVNNNSKTQNGTIVSDTKISDKKNVIKKVEVKALVTDKVSVSVKKNRKSAKNDESVETRDVEDKDSGEWVQLISKKERKNRKQKEEQLLKDLNHISLDNNGNIKTIESPKKSSKKG